MQIAASPGLLDDLAAASQDADAYHHDLCQQFDDEAPAVCTCGAPALLRRLAAMVGVGSSWPLETGPIPARIA